MAATRLGVRRSGRDQVIPRPAHVWVKPFNPWSKLDVSNLRSLDATVERVRRMTTSLAVLPPAPDARVSAVLVGLFEGDNGTEVILTRRSKLLRSHMGEIAFPGGRLDADETPREAALREAHEEIDLDPAGVEVIGELSAVTTNVSTSYVVPIVATVSGRPSLDVVNDEVDRVFTVPLIELIRDDTYHEELWGQPPDQLQMHFYDLEDETIWGATGRMLYQLLSIAVTR
jgi:8-oxo-dGTP pyrophosphatase MutT (NUDIX family)